MNVFLASSSPRRFELLKLIFDEFSVINPDVDENIPKIPPEIMVAKLAEIKADYVINKLDYLKDSLIISADTIVYKDDEILGKPLNQTQAKEMLQKLSDNTHCVYTGVCVIYNDIKFSFYEKSEVTFY
jgi:septum formation protein